MNVLSVLFVCWSNTCRSPMAQVVGQAMAERDRLGGIEFTSAGLSAAHAGEGMDPRAVAVLQAAGYATGPHTAHRVTPEEIRAAAMVIGMQPIELRQIRKMVPDARTPYLLTDFDRNAIPGSAIEDPLYGDDSSFKVSLHQIEAAMPGVLKRVRELRAR
ncbi:MAG TPA: low molecular weight protein-tyrosine-phosphatase [Propionicimonas sp.]|nr:low molecular weight protein-tyrosine-phosphatase [Propionicimonas sp.]